MTGKIPDPMPKPRTTPLNDQEKRAFFKRMRKHPNLETMQDLLQVLCRRNDKWAIDVALDTAIRFGDSWKGVGPNPFLVMATNAGHPMALYMEARRLHTFPSSNPKDDARAFLMLKQAALSPDYLPAQYELAMCFGKGRGVKLSKTRAARILTGLAQRGYSRSIHLEGKHVFVDSHGQALSEDHRAMWAKCGIDIDDYGKRIQEGGPAAHLSPRAVSKSVG
jgi:hypothetical protein